MVFENWGYQEECDSNVSNVNTEDRLQEFGESDSDITVYLNDDTDNCIITRACT